MNIKLKFYLRKLFGRAKGTENDITMGRITMKANKGKKARRESSGKYYPLPLWKKCTTYLMLILTFQFIVPPHVIAQEIAEAQQRAIIEQNQRNYRTRAPEHVAIARQTEITSQLLIKTCRRIETNLAAGKSIESDIKDIEAFRKNYEAIRERTEKQMTAHRESLVKRNASEKMLKRVDASRTEIMKRFNAMSVRLKEIADNKKNPEKLKAAVRSLAGYLEQYQPKPKTTPKTIPAEKKSVTFPHRSDANRFAVNPAMSIPHNGIQLAAANEVIGDWLTGLDTQAVVGPGTAADLAPTAEVVIDQEIKDLAASLDNNPVKIYEYLRNNFVYEPYWGSVKGTKRTLLEKAGNDVDLSSLMIALLRASGRHARYVCGTIELTAAEASKWIGVDDPAQVAKIFIANGIPVETITAGGKIASVRLNHTWVRAYVDYFPYVGAVNENANTWLEIDPSFKQNIFTASRELETTIGINPDTLYTNLKAQSEVASDATYSTKLPEAFILSEIFSYGEPIRSYLAANSLTSENVFRQRKVVEEKYGLLPTTDQYKVSARGLYFAALPSSFAAKAVFTVKNLDGSTAFTHEAKLAELADKTITIAYNPASEEDRVQIAANESAEEFPIFQINVTPVMKIGNVAVGTGNAIGMGWPQELDVTIAIPGSEPETVTTKLTAGSVNALVFDYQNMVAAAVNQEQKKLAAQANAATLTRDAIGDVLHGMGVSYFHQLDRFSQIAAGSLNVAATRKPSLMKVSWDLNVADQFGMPYTATLDRIKLDILRDIHVPVAVKEGNTVAENQFTYISALTGVVLEHNVLSQPFNSEAASAARVIQQANNLGKKIYTISAQNVNAILPLLTLPQTALNDIRNVVTANIEVTVPEEPVPLNGVNYYAYMKRDIDTSAVEFVLGTLGGGEVINKSLKATDLLLDGASASYKAIARQMADWLNIAEDSTTNAGLAYLPAITAIRKWNANRASLDPVTIPASILALSSPITKVYNQPAILNVVTGDKLISPNGDGVKDAFTFSAVVTRNATWKWQITNPAGTVVLEETNNTPNVNFTFDQNVPDGTYSYRLTATLNGVNADPISGTFKVDCTKPTVAISQPDPATTVTDNKSLALRGTADDINFEKVIITAQGVGMAEPVQIYESSNITVENLLTTISSALYTNGALLITMTATDKAGNSNTVSKTYTLANPVPDNIAPTIQMAVTNPKDNSSVQNGATVDAENGSLNVAITATDRVPESANPVAPAKINLYLDGALLASAASVTELNHILNTMTLRDGTHSLYSEAIDKANNKTRSGELNFTLTSPISNFRVTPDLAKPGTPKVVVTANLRDALEDGQKWVLSFAGPSQIPQIEGNAAAVYGDLDPSLYQDGKYTVTLTVNGKTPSLPFEIDMVKMAPVAKIANIAEGDIIREGLFNLIGTADDADPSDTVSYKIEVLDNEGTVVSNVTPKPWSGSNMKEGRVNNASLGELDFTMLRNNVYTLQLTVSDGEQSSVDSVKFALNSQLKIGNMSFSQQDLVVPVNGQPISVIRSYNSLNTNVKGEFGPGWTYSIRDIEFETNETRANIRDFDGEVFSLRTGGDRDVTITMPDGKRLSFMFKLTQSSQATQPWAVGSWVPAPGVHATLEATCSTKYITLPGGMQFWEAGVYGTPMEYFDFPGFVLTLKDGTKYEIVREDLGFHMLEEYVATPPQVNAYKGGRLKSITDPNGNRTVFEDNEIIAYNASGERTKSIYFDKNGDGLITAIYAPSSLNADGTKPEGAVPQFKYEYDNLKNLVKVHKLIDRTKPVDQQYAVTEYLYGEPSRPHYITAIKDALGNQPMKCIYDENGRLIATEDANGNRVAINHALTGKMETVTDRMGNPTVHSYDERGNIIATIDALGNTVRRSYDSLDNLISVTDALGNTTTFTYDSLGNKTSQTDPLGNVTRYEYEGTRQTKTIDPLGNVTTITYDSNGNQLTVTDALGNTTRNAYNNGLLTESYNENGTRIRHRVYSADGNMTSFTDVSGLTRSISYSSDNLPTENSFVWNDPEGILGSKTVTTKTFYDDQGNVVRSIDADGNESTTLYNAQGKIIASTDKYGKTTQTSYDIKGNKVETIFSDGTVSRSVYDANDREIVTQDRHIPGETATGTRNIYNAVGQIIRVERLNNLVIGLTDDGNGCKASSFVSADVVYSTSETFDAAGRLIARIDAKGNKTSYEFDAAGRNIAVTDALGNRSEYSYDAKGNRIAFKDALNRVTRYTYDANSNLIATEFPDGTRSATTYNKLGQKVSQTDQSGLTTQFAYNDAGMLIKVIKPQVTDENGSAVTPTWTYAYDEYMRMTSVTDPKGRVNKTSYDAFGRKISEQKPRGEKVSYSYNSFGQIQREIDAKGQVAEYVYDSFGRLERKNYYTSSQATSPEESVQIIYDAQGRQHKVVEPRGTTEYTYDLENRITKLQTPEGTINYEYDPQNGQKTRVWTANSNIKYAYDELNRLKTVTDNRNGVTEYTYNKVGARTAVKLPNKVTTEYVYNDLNRLTQVVNKDVAGTVLSSYSYTLAPNGRRTGVDEIHKGSADTNIERSVRYTYDAMNRLITEVSSSTQPTLNYSGVYVYDITGNRIQKALQSNVDGTPQTETINYTYNANDQLLSEASSANGTTVYAYDANGSLTTKYNTTQNFSYTFTYNLQNRLSAAQINRQEEGSPVTISSDYAYNQEGLRVKADTTVNGVQQARAFLLDSGLTGYQQVLEELNGPGGNVVKSYVIGDDVISQTVGGTSHYLLYDGHGSTRQLTTDSATITDSYNYDAYGKMVGGDPDISHPAATDLLYAGEQFDVDLQMQYLRARYYDANSGRFNRADPFEGDNYDPQSLHKYAYAHSDPINNVDPSGEMIVGVIAVMAIQMTINTWVAGAILNWATGGALFSGLRMVIDFLQEPVVWGIAALNVILGLYMAINPVTLGLMLGQLLLNIFTGGVLNIFTNIFSAIDSVAKAAGFLNDLLNDQGLSKNDIVILVSFSLAIVIATTALTVILSAIIVGIIKYVVPVINKMLNFIGGHDAQASTSSSKVPSPNDIGKAGEEAVRAEYNIGSQIKTKIEVNERTRIPDGLTDTVLSEVKNTKKQSYTQQLKDFADFAQQTDRRFDLYMRGDVIVSKQLLDAIKKGTINAIPIPGTGVFSWKQ